MTLAQPIEHDRLDRSREKHTSRKAKPSTKEAPKDWTIKRLDPETIEVTREAARRSGMKINAWVGQALEKAASAPSGSLEDRSLADDPQRVLRLEQSILDEITRLRAQNEDLVQTVNSMSAILLKMYTRKLENV